MSSERTTGPGPTIGVRPDDVPRTDPPPAADEATMLRSFVDFYRATIRRQCAGLTAEQLRTPHPPSTMTLAGMLKHLAYVEDVWFSVRLRGNDPAPPWDTVDWSADRDWDWNSALSDTPEQLTALFDDAVAASERILDEVVAGGLDQEVARRPAHAGHGGAVTLRWILVHMVEEYSRHAGHADLLREALDGATDL
ncbi:DinB family protein [Promicromonospora sukumoe]|uniref:Putative damage-inducible protein DinB n=1 Tax=Promicromonospora sukumoe TaxID=88382 RepID=A0A7W3PDV9_9MICO|nr:DinB family protein [Promicromonospora sukumoe]MBA8808106.1 putative damage-inducible protein DinB [Promicromonospora sukumoe]